MRSAADTAHGSSQLAFTGVDVAVFVVIASILIAAGWGLVLLSRAAVRRSFAVDVAIRVCVIIGVVLGGCTVPAAQSAWASGSNVSTSADCQDSPPAVLPEVPQAVTLPITGMALGAGMYLLTRRRIRQNRPS